MTMHLIIFAVVGIFNPALAKQLIPRCLSGVCDARPEPFDWSSIKTYADLRYQHCYDTFECARLSLPLDYHSATDTHNISLAVIRLPAAVPEDDPRHGGSIMINPGGPGGSGVQFAVSHAKRLQEGLGTADKHFEIVSFDPRGILHSKPNLYCFATPFESEVWTREKHARGNLDAGEDVVNWQWTYEMAMGRVCEGSQTGKWEDGTDLRRFVSTAFVATDMLKLVERIDERKQASTSLLVDAIQTPMDSTTRRESKLQFYGQSYGTFLGQAFAAMYSESVGRMILDSNIDGDNWTSDHEYSIDDTETIIEYFFEQCAKVKDACAFWRSGDRDGDDVKHRHAELLARLEQQPALVIGQGHATIITPDQLLQAAFMAAYQPGSFFPGFAQLLDDLFAGRSVTSEQVFWEAGPLTYKTFASEESAHILQNTEIGASIHCSDGPDLTDHNQSSFLWHLHDLVRMFPQAGAIQAEYKLPCWTMPPSLRTKWRYEGPFESNATPSILFINNRLDPATPAKSARKMAKRFTGSKLVISENVGHAALWTGGECLWAHARQYMQDGTMPEEHESWCGAVGEPFGSQEEQVSGGQ